MADTQISSYISESTRQQVEQYVEAHGVKKGHFFETALLHHLKALRELPADIIIPPKLELTVESLERVSDLLETQTGATDALKELLAGKPVDNF